MMRQAGQWLEAATLRDVRAGVVLPEIVQRYFDAWNRHDAAAVVACFADWGVYRDPASDGPLSGDDIGDYANGLWRALPDLCFDVVSAAVGAEGERGIGVAVEWRMQGVQRGPLLGLPPGGREVMLPGVDFITVESGSIRRVEGYFDPQAFVEQLGLQAVAQPERVGPFTQFAQE